MRREIIGNLMGVKSVMLFVLALAIMVGAGPALAQDLIFRTLTIDFYKSGVSTNLKADASIASASGILCASDTDKDIYRKNDNGSDNWDVNPDGRLNSNPLKVDANGKPVNVNLLKQTIDRPIIANIEPGEQLNLAAIIDGVTEADVTALRNGSAVPAENSVMSAIINMVTADFSAGLFAANTPSTFFSGIHPTYATTTFDVKASMNGGVFSPTSVIVYWNISSLIVSATGDRTVRTVDPAVSLVSSELSLSATMAIFGGGVTADEQMKRVGKSNFVGVETGINSAPVFLSNWARMADSAWGTLTTIVGDDYVRHGDPSGNNDPFDDSAANNVNLQYGLYPGVNMGIILNSVTDKTSNAYFGAPSDINLDSRRFVAGSTADPWKNDTDHVPFQLRKGDIANIKVEIDERASQSGEPVEYFGANSDAISGFDASTGDAKTTLIGGKLALSAWKPSDMGSVFTNITYDGTAGTADGSEYVFSLSGQVADTVITSGSYRVFVVKAVIQDEVQSATEVSTTHAVDTAPPLYTQTTAWAQRGTGQIQGGDIGVGNPTRNTAYFGLEIDGNGERSIQEEISKWIRIAARDFGARRADFVANPPNFDFSTNIRWSDLDNNDLNAADNRLLCMNPLPGGYPEVESVALNNALIKNIPGTALVLGASVVIKISNNVTTTINSGGLIVSVSDDARNPAIIYYRSDNDPTKVTISDASAVLNTVRKGFSISNFSPLTYNTISPATVEIDNSPPEILVAELRVRNLPQGYWNAGATLDTFKTFENALESAGAKNLRTGLFDRTTVIRGAPKSTALLSKQSGSPLRLVVKFRPSKDILGDDSDNFPYDTTSVAEQIAAFQQRFAFDIANKDIGFATTSQGVYIAYDNPAMTAPLKDSNGNNISAWNVIDATIDYGKVSGKWDGNPATVIGYVTFETNDAVGGIQYFDDSKEAGIVSTGQFTKFIVSAADSVWNNDDWQTALALQNTIFVDTLAPAITGTDANYDEDGAVGGTVRNVVKPKATTPWGVEAAGTGLYITNWNGTTSNAKIDPAYARDKSVCVFSMDDLPLQSNPATLVDDSFYNSATVSDATAVGVLAGYSIIISAKFQEDNPNAPGTLRMLNEISIGGGNYSKSGFPFLFSTPAVTDPLYVAPLTDWTFDGAVSTLYGRNFKTITADFSDFINEDSSRDILPDVTSVVNPAAPTVVESNDASGPYSNLIAPERIVAATWFLYVDGSKNLNVAMKASDIRMVTLTARDLSGNVARFSVATATAAFAKPQVAILDYEIDNPARGFTRAVVQRDSSYLSGAGVAAFSLSQATMNISSATVMVVARIGDGVSRGGPFIQTGFIKADFSCFGGGTSVAPNLITTATGVVVTNGLNVGPTEILYATWWTDKFAAAPAKDTGGAKSAKVIVSAIASTYGEGSAEASGIQVDHTAPDQITGAPVEDSDIKELTWNSVRTNPAGDLWNDNIIRPNQKVSFFTRFTMDNADKANTSLILFAPDLKQFGNPAYSLYTWKNAAGTLYGATFEFTVPLSISSGMYKAISYATDAAGNFLTAGKQTNVITVNSSRPEIQSIVLSASNVINYATYSAAPVNRWRYIGTRVSTNPSSPTINEATGLIKAGDALMVTATINISDDVFSDLDVYADFSKFSGDAFSRVVPARVASANKDTIQQGTHVAGTILYATWVHYVQSSSINVLDASVRIVAVNPSGIPATEGPMSYSVPISVDNKGPVVTESVTYYKNGVTVTGDEFNPNNIALQPGSATAEVIVNATFEDSGIRNGNAASIFAALWFMDAGQKAAFTGHGDGGTEAGGRPAAAGFNVDNHVTQNAAFRLDANGVGVVPYPKASWFALTDKTGVYNNDGSSTDGVVITSASDMTAVGATTPDPLNNRYDYFLKSATSTVLNIWWGKYPKGDPWLAADAVKSTTIAENVGKASYQMIASVSDVVGNKTSASVSGIEIDGWKPVMSTKGDKSVGDNGLFSSAIKTATLDVAPGQVPYKDYVPAQYAGNEIQRPTRVTNGTLVRVVTNLFDGPDWLDPITFSISGTEFGTKASSFVVVSPTPGQHTPQSNVTEYVWQTIIDPKQFSGNVIGVTVDIPIGFNKSTPGNSTIPYDKDSLDEAIDLPTALNTWRANGYHDLMENSIKAPNKDEHASITMDATDTVKNWVKEVYAPLGIEIDTEGPGIVGLTKAGEFVSFLPSKEKVDELFTASSWTLPVGINAGAGSYLVWAATLVVDGTNDADFPMDKFSIDWAAQFEFDVSRLDHDKHYTGKKYLVSSATRSIIYVTDAIKIRDDADPRNATNVNYQFEDIFGNVTKGKSQDKVAISSQGPTATEISIKVDGKAQELVGPGNLGIGNKGPDSVGAKFEIYPGATVVVEATITTIDGEAPDTILLDGSDLYPSGLKTMTDELIPSVTQMTTSGMIYARWEYIAFDMANLLPIYDQTVFGANLAAFGAETPKSATRTFFDQSNLNWLLLKKDYTQGDVNSAWNGGLVFNGPVFGATPAAAIDANGAAYTGAVNTPLNLKGGPRNDSWVASRQDAFNALSGLPYMTVQKDATAKKVAWVTIFVADDGSFFDPERAFSSNFSVDTEPPRAGIVFNVTQTLPVRWRFMPDTAKWRIGFPTAPNADKDNIFDPAPRVRENDSVAIIVQITNSLIDRTGNDAFRNLPGLLPMDLSTGFFRIEYSDKPANTKPINSSIRDVTVDLSGLSSLPGMNNLSVFKADAPVANPAYPNVLTIGSQGTGNPDLITATFTVKVSSDLGKSVQLSNDPVDVTVTVSDDAGNRPLDTPYDKNVMNDYYNSNFINGSIGWVKDAANKPIHPESVLAVDNIGPFISGSVQAQIISGTAMVDNPVTLEHDILGPGAVLQDESIIAAGSVLRVTVTVTDQVDHPLDLLITQKDPITGKVIRFMGNYGEMMLQASGLKLADSRLVAEDAKLSGPDSISVPFQVTVPSKETGKSTFSFRFICQATDTVGNMSEKVSVEKFAFDANPDVSYSDSLGQVVSGGSVKTINAGSASQFVLSASAIDVGGIKTVEWVTSGNANVTFSAKDKNGADVPNLLLNAGEDDHALLDLFALIPVVGAGIDPFAVKAVVTDIDNNINEESIVTFNINQPPIFAASFPYDATNDSNIVKSNTAAEVTGVGYNTAFADIREVTIEEGTSLFVKINATDANVADVLTFSATGTAITSPVIIEGKATSTVPGELDFSFKPGFLAVTGEAKSATFGLDVNVSDGTTILPDTASLVFNVIAKSATPIVTITSINIDGVPQANPNTVSLLELKEGSKLQVAYKGQDPGNEKLVSSLEAIPVAVKGATEVTVSAEGIVYATFTYTAGLQDADVPELSYDSPVDPFIANFAVANASYSSSKIVPVDIINVSQAPIISATAIVNIDAPKAIADGGILKVKPASQVIVQFKALDPDGDAVLTTYDPVITGVTSYTYTALSIGKASFESMLTVMIPEKVSPEEVTTTVVYKAGDNTLMERTFTFQIVVEEEAVHPVEAKIDQLIVAQGFGGTNSVNYKNIDPAVTSIDGKAVAVNSTYRSVAVASGAFLENIGGGPDRAAYADLGDIDDDGDMDIVLSMGSVTLPDATSPNIVVVKDAKTKALVGNSFVAFPSTSYDGGDTPIAVGNFIGSSTAEQIATAQGFGGNNLIRIYQYTGLPRPYGFAVVAQFSGLSGQAVTNNANGGLSLAAGDLTGDGVDELIVGQTNSATSRTQFTVIGLNADGTVNYRFPGVAFTRKFQGNGGVNIAVADLDGNGTNEILLASAGNTKDFVENEDGRNGAVINVISIKVPTVTGGKVSGFAVTSGSVRNVFSEAINPSGAQSIAAIEGNGVIGSETVLGTNAVLSIDGTTITPVKPAPQPRYTVVKIDFNGLAVTGISKVLGQASEGLNAFPPDLAPTSGGVNVIAGQIE